MGRFYYLIEDFHLNSLIYSNELSVTAYTGFWAYLRLRYHADYIVVDAKNYSQQVTKKKSYKLQTI